MKQNVVFLRCSHCGAIVGVIKQGAKIMCCGEPMQELVANSTDAAEEKHVPVASRRDGKIFVEVGSTLHPSSEEHLIEWIAAVTPESTQRFSIQPGQKPSAEFIDYGDTTIYAFCNLHGLWKASV